MTGEYPAQRAINVKNVSILWRHHDTADTCIAQFAKRTRSSGYLCRYWVIRYCHRSYIINHLGCKIILIKAMTLVRSHQVQTNNILWNNLYSSGRYICVSIKHFIIENYVFSYFCQVLNGGIPNQYMRLFQVPCAKPKPIIFSTKQSKFHYA